MRVTPSVYLVGDGDMGISDPEDCHIWLVKGPGGIFLVDGGGGNDIEPLLTSIRNEGFDPKDISHILLTHHHTDHSRSAKALKDTLSAEVWISANKGAYWLEKGTDEELYIDFAKKHGMYPQDYFWIHCPVDHAIEDGEEFTIGGVNIKAINVEGHSTDSLVYLMDLDGFRCAFIGDIIMVGGELGLLNWPDSKLEMYRRDRHKLENLGIDTLLPGHKLFIVRNGQTEIDKALSQLDSIFVPISVGQHLM